MPEEETLRRARKDKRQGKAASTQAGEFVREEIHHVREGKHGARSTKQAIAIGLSKARRAGVALPSPRGAKASTKRSARSATRAGRRHAKPATRRSRGASPEGLTAREPPRGLAHGSRTSGEARCAASPGVFAQCRSTARGTNTTPPRSGVTRARVQLFPLRALMFCRRTG